jgi:hypothetical protein
MTHRTIRQAAADTASFQPPAGLSQRTQELWLAAARYRRIADDLAADSARPSR